MNIADSLKSAAFCLNSRKLPLLAVGIFRSLSRCLLLGVVIVSGCTSEIVDEVSVPAEPALVERGFALVTGVAACASCHGAASSEIGDPLAPLTGGRTCIDKYGAVLAPNLTPADGALKDWSAQDIVKALRFSIGKDERLLSKDVHSGYEWIAEEDALSIVAYLKAIPPIINDVERREIGVIDQNTKGFFEARPDGVGYVPVISSRYPAQHGSYLVDHVARCGSCHNGPEDFLGDAEYLSGGREISLGENDASVRIAPSLLNHKQEGLGSWTEEDVKRYLREGVTPSGRIVDARYCPVRFFSRASDKEREAIAAYLKSQTAG